MKYTEIKIRYPDSRIKALQSVLTKKNIHLEKRLIEAISSMYRM